MKRTGIMILAAGLFLFIHAAQADWTPAQRLTWTSGLSYAAAIAVDLTGGLHVVWSDRTPGNDEIYYMKSTDGGATWTTEERLTSTSGYSLHPAIAVDSLDNLHVVWEDNTPGNDEIYYMKSTDGGATWSASQRATWTSGSSRYPAIAVDSSDNLHVVWQEALPGTYSIYYMKSTDGGAGWTSIQQINRSRYWSEDPDIAVDPSGNLHLVWVGTPRNFDIQYKKSKNGGITWTTRKRLTWNWSVSLGPDIAVDPSGNLHLVWEDTTPGNYEIYYIKSKDGGITWTTPKRLTRNHGASQEPDIAVDSSGNLHLVWKDTTPGNLVIYYKKSTNRGATWTTSERLTWNSGIAADPDIAVDPFGNLHLVWQDNTPGELEIYYMKFIK